VVVVHGVEPDERGEQPDVSFGEPVAHEVPAVVGQPLLQRVEPGEEPVVGRLVCLL
jgi:hypothetical protein